MNKKRRTYRIIIVHETNGIGTVSFQVSRTVISFLIAGLSAIIVVSAFFMYKSIQVAGKLNYYNTLQSDNERLLNDNKKLNIVQQKFMHMDSIATYLEQLSSVTRPSINREYETKNATEKKAVLMSAKKKDSTESNQRPSILPVDGWITQNFSKDTTHDGVAHPGLDIAAPAGTVIKAPANGIVVAVLQDIDYGTMVVLKHDNGIITRYGHCAKAMVSINDKIVQGQTIALVGNTGHSSAPHLHYELIKDGKNEDPLQYLVHPEETIK
jgi:murein DD-endopeptidase MepM/ murein hydrolase activator NlpD